MPPKIIKHIVLYFCVFTLFLGIYFCMYGNHYFRPMWPPAAREGYENEISTMNVAAANTEAITDPSNELCPDMLIRRGEKIVLYNSKLLQLPALTFQNLDEYTAYLEKQRENGLRCPVLYLQEENNAQGETVYRIRPTMDGTENGLPANTTFIPGSVLAADVSAVPQPTQYPHPIAFNDSSRDNSPYNQGGYYPFDPQGLHVGDFTEIDQIHHIGEKNYISDNPMDPNWGGPEFSKAVVSSGAYNENVVTRPVVIQSNHGPTIR